MAIFGFIGFLVAACILAYFTVAVGFIIVCGGEEFSPVSGRQAVIMWLVLGGLIALWALLFDSAPFTISVDQPTPSEQQL